MHFIGKCCVFNALEVLRNRALQIDIYLLTYLLVGWSGRLGPGADFASESCCVVYKICNI